MSSLPRTLFRAEYAYFPEEATDEEWERWKLRRKEERAIDKAEHDAERRQDGEA